MVLVLLVAVLALFGIAAQLWGADSRTDDLTARIRGDLGLRLIRRPKSTAVAPSRDGDPNSPRRAGRGLLDS